jgi:hypothetical protein
MADTRPTDGANGDREGPQMAVADRYLGERQAGVEAGARNQVMDARLCGERVEHLADARAAI